MAGADYYSCDECGCKTFYDAALNYDDGNKDPVTHHPWPDGNVGYMRVLCRECAKPAVHDCMTCARLSHYDNEPDCTMEFPLVCINGDAYLPAAPVRLYQRGGR